MGGGSDVFDMGMAGVIPAMFNKKSNPTGTGGTPGLEGLFTGGAPGSASAPPAAAPGAFSGVPTRQLPGFSGPGGGIPLFGRLSPEQLAAYNAANGTAPVKPPPMKAPAKSSGLFKRATEESPYNNGRNT